MSPARTRTRTAHFGLERTNREATAPPTPLYQGHMLKGTSTPTKESLEIAGYNICNNASFNFFSRRVSTVEKNEF